MAQELWAALLLLLLQAVVVLGDVVIFVLSWPLLNNLLPFLSWDLRLLGFGIILSFKLIFSIFILIILIPNLLVLCRSALTLYWFPDIVASRSYFAVLTLPQGFRTICFRCSLLRVKPWDILLGPWSLSRSLVWHVIISLNLLLWLLMRVPILFLILVDNISDLRCLEFLLLIRAGIVGSWGLLDRSWRWVVVRLSLSAAVTIRELW